jgi:hypothetical protein
MTPPRRRPCPKAAAVLTVAILVIGTSARPVHAAESSAKPDRAEQAMTMIDVLRGYLELIERYDRIAADSRASGVAAVLMAEELLKGRSPADAIEYYTNVLPEVKNDAVRRVIRIQLADLYKNTGQTDKALEQLRILMTGAAPDPPPPPPPSAAQPRLTPQVPPAPEIRPPPPPQPGQEKAGERGR